MRRPAGQQKHPEERVEERRPHQRRDLRVTQVILLSEREWSLPERVRDVVAQQQRVHEVRGLVGVVAGFRPIRAGEHLEHQSGRQKQGQPQGGATPLAHAEVDRLRERFEIGGL